MEYVFNFKKETNLDKSHIYLLSEKAFNNLAPNHLVQDFQE